jgi:uncharacterized membrane protein
MEAGAASSQVTQAKKVAVQRRARPQAEKRADAAGPWGGPTDNGSREEARGLERLIFFSDAVFAIAITLLSLDIRLPAEQAGLDASGLGSALAGLWHQYLAFVISFLVIGTFWMGHHRKFHYIRRYDNRLLALNLLMLMVVAFVPFPTSVLSQSGNITATLMYAVVMALAGVVMTGLWLYAAHRDRLIDPGLTARQRRAQVVAPLATTAVFVVSICVAFVVNEAARLIWLLALPASLLANRS